MFSSLGARTGFENPHRWGGREGARGPPGGPDRREGERELKVITLYLKWGFANRSGNCLMGEGEDKGGETKVGGSKTETQ